MKPNIHSGHIEVATSKLLNYRINTIVPNVSWGLGLNHECDMLSLDSKNRFTEIEIKISASDLRADFNKPHGHRSKYISRLVYALPDWLFEKHGDLIPKQCGVITVSNMFPEHEVPTYKAEWVRIPKHDKTKDKVPDKVVRKFMELGCMRIWSLKNHNNNRK